MADGRDEIANRRDDNKTTSLSDLTLFVFVFVFAVVVVADAAASGAALGAAAVRLRAGRRAVQKCLRSASAAAGEWTKNSASKRT